MADRPPVRSRRLLKLASMTASVAGNFAASRLARPFLSGEEKDAHDAAFLRAAGVRLASTLGELKGAAMKVGQMASTASDLLPPELADALARLQQDAPAMPFEVVAEQIESELGEAPERLFARFEEQPFASASIGQVHRATTDDGREVVVKVQYPGVDAAVDSDLASVRTALRLARLASDRAALDAVMAELKDRLNEELDYCIEADHVRLFRELHAGEERLVLPDVVGERSAQRVLTLTYEGGARLTDVASWDQEVRDAIGRRMIEMVCDQIFVHGVVHGDPHPGNLAFRPDGTVVLYDFGCVRRYDEATVEAFRDVVRSVRDLDATLMDSAFLRLGVRAPHRPPPLPVWEAMIDVLAPLRGESFDFGAARFNEQFVTMAPTFIRYARDFLPGAEIAIVKRVVAGLYDNLRTLGARVPAAEVLAEYVGR